MKTTLPLLLLMLLTWAASAQQEQEAGLRAGISNYQGDLVPKSIDLSQSGLSLGLTYRNFFLPQIAVNGSVSFNRIKADERNYPERVGRGAVMEANLIEVSATGEWHPFGRERFNSLGVLNRRVSPFIYIGLGMAFGKTDVQLTGNKEITPEQTDSKYFILPFGGGLRYHLNDLFTLTADIGARPVFSDQLDGISINGNSNANDWYLQTGITLLYNLVAD